MKTLIGMVAVMMLVSGVASAEGHIYHPDCNEQPGQICLIGMDDVLPGVARHVIVAIPETDCFPVVTAHRLSQEPTWQSQSAPGTYAVVSGISGPADPTVSFVVRNDSDVRVEAWLGFQWACMP